MDSLSGKVAVVTGSSSGIGRAAAVAFAKHGARTVLCGRNEDALKKAQQECFENGAKSEHVVYVKADLSNEEGMQAVINRAITAFGGIDILVNNAGIAVFGNVEQTKMEDFDAVFNVNVRAYFRLTQLAIPYLKKSKGSVVNVSSVYGLRAYPDTAAYNMTKGAINMFTDTLALELAPYKVRVNAVCPGEIKTSMQQAMGIDNLDQYFKDIAKLHPLNQIGEPEDVANLITFLASDAAGFITGAKIPIDGGQSITAAWFGSQI